MTRRIIPSVPGGLNSWEELMLLALKEAKKATFIGEVPVGALVISSKGKVIGSGYNSCIKDFDPSSHAEIKAIKSAALNIGNYRLNNCVMIVTLEPCIMCLGAIVNARLAGVVFGAYDDKTGAIVSCMDGFELPFLQHRVWSLGGICEQECSSFIKEFFVDRRN